VGVFGVTTSLLGLAPTVLTLAVAFVLGLAVAALVANEELGTDFFGLAIFVVAVTFRDLRHSVTG
jgi:hypothetical protein